MACNPWAEQTPLTLVRTSWLPCRETDPVMSSFAIRTLQSHSKDRARPQCSEHGWLQCVQVHIRRGLC